MHMCVQEGVGFIISSLTILFRCWFFLSGVYVDMLIMATLPLPRRKGVSSFKKINYFQLLKDSILLAPLLSFPTILVHCVSSIL